MTNLEPICNTMRLRGGFGQEFKVAEAFLRLSYDIHARIAAGLAAGSLAECK
jgi:hypothetical protein